MSDFRYKIRFNYHGYNRTVKLWWKPFYWLGSCNWFRYAFGTHFGKWTWWVRKYLTYD